MGIKVSGLFFLLCLPFQLVIAESLKSLVVPEKYKQGIIWKIDLADKEPSYLMGTMHVDDPGVWKLFEQAQKHFDHASTVCTEVKMDFETMGAELQAMFFNDGRTLKSVMSDNQLYDEVIQAAVKHGLPEASVRHMKPFTLAFMLSMPISTGEVLDSRIFTDAIRQGKQVCGLETIDEHSAVFQAFDMSAQLKILKSTVSRLDEVSRIYPEMLEAYLNRDLEDIVRLANESMSMDEAEIEKTFYQRFLIDRNIKMVERMEPLISKGRSFFAVGAMHLTGKAGILRLLEERGYKISVVY